MSYFIFFSVIIGFACLAYTEAQIFRSILCHQCTPQTEGVNCTELTTNATLVTCNNMGIQDLLVGCYSAYHDYTNVTLFTQREETGIYRGCAHRPENVLEFCPIHEKSLAVVNISVSGCQSCDYDGCNTHIIELSGSVKSKIITSLMFLTTSFILLLK